MTPINQHTKISTIIKTNPDSIEAIASLAKPLKKLKNPILRRLMAPRVTLGEAATMGGCTVDDFKRVLEPLGFTFEHMNLNDAKHHTDSSEPVWFGSLKPQTTDEFDVRQMIEEGDDPLKQIMQRYESLPIGHTLCIVNSFVPYPLLQVLGKNGAQYYVQSRSENLHYTWFFKQDTNKQEHQSENKHIVMLDIASFEGVLATYHPQQITVLDVRELPMPQPMETILRALVNLEKNSTLHVYHKRIPLHLLEELEDSIFQIRICEYGKDDIRIIIHHASQ